jgi:hypothetical protein
MDADHTPTDVIRGVLDAGHMPCEGDVRWLLAELERVAVDRDDRLREVEQWIESFDQADDERARLRDALERVLIILRAAGILDNTEVGSDEWSDTPNDQPTKHQNRHTSKS